KYLDFLASMKTDRVATFCVLDKKLQLKVKRREERQAAAAARQSRCEKELEEMKAMSSLVSESGTRRWPVAVFYNVLDLAAINAWLLYQSCMSQNIPKRDFMFQLAHELRAEWMASKAPPLVDVLFSGARAQENYLP
ncbi:hypothetical protein KUCAC02_009497, partial [Chaenocephalus aceratus]